MSSRTHTSHQVFTYLLVPVPTCINTQYHHDPHWILCVCVCLLPYSHAESLAALQAYSHWLAQFCSEVQRQQDQTRFVNLITSSMAATTPLISAKVMPYQFLHSLLLTTSIIWLLDLPSLSHRGCCSIDNRFSFIKSFIWVSFRVSGDAHQLPHIFRCQASFCYRHAISLSPWQPRYGRCSWCRCQQCRTSSTWSLRTTTTSWPMR